MSFKFSEIRVLETGYNNAAWNMAVDEVLMNGVSNVPVLRLYGWKPPAVSIGYFQSMEEEVDIKKCNHFGIDVVRRITGGGAVFHDSELTYSFIAREYPQSIIESYRLICNAIVISINKLGFDAKFSPLNDIIINGKKVSGNAQTRKKGTLLQHGTILLNADVEKMFSLLKVPSEKIRDKIITDVKERVMGLNKTFDEVASALKIGFSEKFDAILIADNLSEQEEIDAKKLSKKKYATDKWNLRR
ncbi:MAG: lipoate--protein ligase family protein [Nitrosopumilaceae archaeon]